MKPFLDSWNRYPPTQGVPCLLCSAWHFQYLPSFIKEILITDFGLKSRLWSGSFGIRGRHNFWGTFAFHHIFFLFCFFVFRHFSFLLFCDWCCAPSWYPLPSSLYYACWSQSTIILVLGSLSCDLTAYQITCAMASAFFFSFLCFLTFLSFFFLWFMMCAIMGSFIKFTVFRLLVSTIVHFAPWLDLAFSLFYGSCCAPHGLLRQVMWSMTSAFSFLFCASTFFFLFVVHAARHHGILRQVHCI